MSYLSFDLYDLEDFGLIISRESTFDAVERDVTIIGIPGRDGDLIQDNGRFFNQKLEYPFSVKDMSVMHDLRSYLLARSTKYYRLYDSADPEHFRLARFMKMDKVSTTQYNRHGKSKITLDAKPQRYLLSGDGFVRVTNTIYNPSDFESKPVIRVTGTGNVKISINSQVVTITGLTGSVDIDSELQDCYSGTTNKNGNVAFGGAGYPLLKPGSNSFSVVQGTAVIEVKGRWYDL